LEERLLTDDANKAAFLKQRRCEEKQKVAHMLTNQYDLQILEKKEKELHGKLYNLDMKLTNRDESSPSQNVRSSMNSTGRHIHVTNNLANKIPQGSVRDGSPRSGANFRIKSRPGSPNGSQAARLNKSMDVTVNIFYFEI
jgi:hypothetical protein